MDIKTTNEIFRLEIEWGKVDGLTFKQINQIHKLTKEKNKRWVAVDDVIKILRAISDIQKNSAKDIKELSK